MAKSINKGRARDFAMPWLENQPSIAAWHSAQGCEAADFSRGIASELMACLECVDSATHLGNTMEDGPYSTGRCSSRLGVHCAPGSALLVSRSPYGSSKRIWFMIGCDHDLEIGVCSGTRVCPVNGQIKTCLPLYRFIVYSLTYPRSELHLVLSLTNSLPVDILRGCYEPLQSVGLGTNRYLPLTLFCENKWASFLRALTRLSIAGIQLARELPPRWTLSEGAQNSKLVTWLLSRTTPLCIFRVLRRMSGVIHIFHSPESRKTGSQSYL